ncbi:hypothetical protein ACTFIY_001029 [Dictyostelium cf. discoideum]
MEISKLLNKYNKSTFSLQNNFVSYREKLNLINQHQQEPQQQEQQIQSSFVNTHYISNNIQECLNEKSNKVKKCRHVGCNKPLHTKHRRRHETSVFHQRRPCPTDCLACTGEFKKGRQRINYKN